MGIGGFPVDGEDEIPMRGEVLYCWVFIRGVENLYAWMDYEAIGQRAMELLIDERHYGFVERIMERLSMGHS
ncbi:hypothetical protein AMTR_s00039p00169180 [Amborella trichopoda]|uniref:Uncharacterized protein n=1 Tax=Amborella trichopoda TaxID=13333 RepID=U5D345_AMBTC|nr:hypothetical protein AMTR_s00039p00169180 [Amborella trichopoda]